MNIFNFFNRGKKVETQVKQENNQEWEYIISVDKIPKNQFTNLIYGTMETGKVKDTVIPRVGESILVGCDTDSTLFFEGTVTEIFHNHPLKFISISVDCTNVSRRNYK